MLSDLLNRRSLGSLNSLQEDSLATFDDAFTIYGHPKVKDVIRAFELQQCITLVEYRTANKLRCIQKKMELHRVNVSDVINIINNANLGSGDNEISEAEMEPILTEICNLQSDLDNTTVSNTDLILTWILQMFDGNYTGSVSVKRFTMALLTLCNGRLLDKLTYIFNQFKDPDSDLLTKEAFHFLFCDLLLIPCSVFEEESYGNTQIVLSAAYDCFSQNFEAENVNLETFLTWCMGSPHSIAWLLALHRVMSSEYTINNIPCTSCYMCPYLGFRYESLYSYNVSLCQHCVWKGCVPFSGHYREYGSLGNSVNVYVNKDRNASQHSKSDLEYMEKLDDSYRIILDYSKRLDPASISHFVINLHEALSKTVEDDSVLAFVEECEDRSVKLTADYAVLVNSYRGVREADREGATDRLEVWKKYDELAFNVNMWMLKRNEQYIKQEALLRESDILPTQVREDNEPKLKIQKPPFPSRVGVDDQMLVLSKLSLLVNNALLQQSISEIGQDAEPTTPKLEDNIAPLTPIANPVALGFYDNKDNQMEQDAMKEFESVVNGIIVQENLNSTTHFIPVRPAFNLNSCCREPDNNNTGDEKYVDGIVIINPDDDNTNQTLNNLNNDCDSKDVYNNLNVNELVKLSQSSHYEKSFDSDNSYAKRQIEMYENDNSSYVKKGFFGKSPVSTIQSDNTELRGDCNNAKEGVSVADTRSTTQIPSKIPRSSKIPTPCKNVLTKPREKLVRFGPSTTVRSTVSIDSSDAGTDRYPSYDSKQDSGTDRFPSYDSKQDQSKDRFPSHDSKLEEEEEEWISDGDWETEEEVTINNDTSSTSDPPRRLHLTKAESISEPECDLSDTEAMPVPPPRTLLSPINSSRRATSLKTKEGDPRKDELRKAMKAPKNNSFNSGSITSRIPTPRSKAGLSENTPSPSKTPSKQTTTSQKKVITGPIVDEGDSDSTTSTSSSSSSGEKPRKKRSNFSRARSARFARSKVPVPDRNAASFRNKKGVRVPPIEELGFMNRFAE